MVDYSSFETERLILRPITVDDGAFYCKLMNTPKWHKYIGDRHVHTDDEARAYVQTRMLSQWESKGYGNYVVLTKTDGLPVGCVGIFVRDGLEGADLGYALMPEAEKQGYAFESARRLLTEAFARFHLPFLNAITGEDNASSQRLLDKLGFRFVETITLPNETKSCRKYIVHNPDAVTV